MNEYKIELKIGEFSKLNRVTVKTLRHYEEIGLLIPCKNKKKWKKYLSNHFPQLLLPATAA